MERLARILVALASVSLVAACTTADTAPQGPVDMGALVDSGSDSGTDSGVDAGTDLGLGGVICQTDADCTYPGWGHCNSGICGVCSVNADCPANHPICFVNFTAICMGCGTDPDCTDPSAPYCVSNSCMACRDDSNCTNPALPGCRASVSGYRSCSVCTTDAHCTDPTRPHCGVKRDTVSDNYQAGCWPCVTSDQCLARAGTTENIACTDYGTCVPQVCYAQSGCPTGYFCNNVCLPKCTTDADCANPAWSAHGGSFGPYCNTATGGCQACTTDAHCTDPANPRCSPSRGTCQYECARNEDCTDPAKPTCYFTTGKNGYCG